MTRKEKRLARITALQAQYACEMSGIAPGLILDHLAEEDLKLTPEILKYSGKLVRLVLNNLEFANKVITERSNNWDIQRITLLDRLIIRLALVEMLFVEEVPPKVSISESVEIAKLFSTEGSGAFVNGILDSIYNDMLKGKINLPDGNVTVIDDPVKDV